MKIFVQAKPNAKTEKVEKIDSARFVVSVKEPPVQGRANQAVIILLAKYFDVRPYQVKIISGFKSKQKIIEIDF